MSHINMAVPLSKCNIACRANSTEYVIKEKFPRLFLALYGYFYFIIYGKKHCYYFIQSIWVCAWKVNTHMILIILVLSAQLN